MTTKIISAFPGTGKTFYHSKHPETTLDSDSSNFSWILDENGSKTNVRNPDFPNNYIQHVKENIGKYEFIFVSSHKEVRDALIKNNIFFYLVYPSINRKNEFIQRYKDRGNTESFIKLVDDKWVEWISDIEWEDCNGCHKLNLVLNNLEDEINYLKSLINEELI